jgi:transcriptional regulator with XRE-family HTH domain
MHEKKVKIILTNIKLRRKALGYTQQCMADKLGINQNVYSKIELNNIRLTACRFLLICDLLEVEVDEILKGINRS